MNSPFAYFLTFTTYGTRLHGDPRGSVTRSNAYNFAAPVRPNRRRMVFELDEMEGNVVVLGATARAIVEDAIRGVCSHRGWELFAVNVRSNHVHVLAEGPVAPETMLQAFKSWATRRLREDALIEPEQRVWARHGSTRYIWDESDAERVWGYVVHGQDAPREE